MTLKLGNDWHRSLLRSPEGEGGGDGGEPGPGDGRQGVDPGDGGGGDGSPKTVTMSQAALDRLIDDRIGRTARKVRAEAEEAEAKRLKSLGVDSWDDLAERMRGEGGSGGAGSDVKKAIAEATGKVRAEFEQRESKLSDKLKRAEVLAEKLGVRNAVKACAQELGAYSGDQVFELLRASFQLDMEGGEVTVLTEGGNPTIDATTGQPMTVEQRVAEFARENAHLFRQDAKRGPGKGNADAAGSNRTHYKRSELASLSREEKERVAKGLDDGSITVDASA